MWGPSPVALRVLAVVLSSAASACLLELDQSIACGDAYVDRDAGEQCDPRDPLSFIDECRGRPRPDQIPSCHPTTCELDLTVCYNPCGNGVVDEHEECDFRAATPDDLSAGDRSCAGLHPLSGGAPYTGGEVTLCMQDCRWDRSQCNYCGNGRIDEEFGEACDGTDGRREACVEACMSNSEVNIACNVSCKDDCSDWQIPGLGGGIDDWKSAGQDALQCCYKQGPVDEFEGYDCCPGYALTNGYCVLQELTGET